MNTTHFKKKLDLCEITVGSITGWTTGTESIRLPISARTIIDVQLYDSTTGALRASTVNSNNLKTISIVLNNDTGPNTSIDYRVTYERGAGATVTITQIGV